MFLSTWKIKKKAFLSPRGEGTRGTKWKRMTMRDGEEGQTLGKNSTAFICSQWDKWNSLALSNHNALKTQMFISVSPTLLLLPPNFGVFLGGHFVSGSSGFVSYQEQAQCTRHGTAIYQDIAPEYHELKTSKEGRNTHQYTTESLRVFWHRVTGKHLSSKVPASNTLWLVCLFFKARWTAVNG